MLTVIRDQICSSWPFICLFTLLTIISISPTNEPLLHLKKKQIHNNRYYLDRKTKFWPKKRKIERQSTIIIWFIIQVNKQKYIAPENDVINVGFIFIVQTSGKYFINQNWINSALTSFLLHIFSSTKSGNMRWRWRILKNLLKDW